MPSLTAEELQMNVSTLHHSGSGRRLNFRGGFRYINRVRYASLSHLQSCANSLRLNQADSESSSNAGGSGVRPGTFVPEQPGSKTDIKETQNFIVVSECSE